MSAMVVWIPRTKLQPPRLRADSVRRKRVVTLLQESIRGKRLTLISAPAGYGKTTLLANWLAEIADDPQKPLVAWLSLDEGDDDPVVFATALAAALNQLDPSYSVSISTGQSRQTTPNLNFQRQMGLLINDIMQAISRPLVLVLDDFHTISQPEIHQGIDYLVQYMPALMHLVVITRIDPPLSLARLRAQGELAEIRPPDLRFTLAETLTLLNRRFALDLPDKTLRTLHTNVAGWAAGLCLWATSLTGLGEAEWAAALDRLPKVNRQVFDLLAEQVLDQQPAAVREFLLTTAILDELTPALCTAVTRNPQAPQLLDEVSRRHLFLTVSKADEEAYQYHDLFRRFLRHQVGRTKPTEVPVLHRRAGEAEPNVSRAIQHYLAAGAYDRAAIRIEQVAEQLFNQGLFGRLQRWIEMIPPTVRDEHPWLNFFLGAAHWGQSRHRAAQPYLETAQAAFALQADWHGLGETMIQLSIVHQTQGDFESAARYITQALDQPISARSRCQAYLAMAWLALARGAVEAAAQDLDAAYEIAETSGDEGAVNICMMQTRLPFQCLPQGSRFYQRLELLLQKQQPGPISPHQAGRLGAQMFIHLWQGDLQSAIIAGEQAMDISRQLGGLTWLMVDTASILAALYAIRGQVQQFDRQMAFHAPYLEKFPAWRRSFLFVRGYYYWVQDRLAEMQLSFEQMRRPLPQEWPSASVFEVAVTGILAIAENDWDLAQIALNEAIALQAEVPVSTFFVDMRLLAAILADRRRQPERALQYLQTVLAEYLAEQKPGSLLLAGPPLAPVLRLAVERDIHRQTCQHLLGQLSQDPSPTPLLVPETGETLTPREVEVLYLLVEGASNKEIADQLVISLPTVKTHVSRILAKLNVKSRAEAIVLVRETNLLFL